MPLLLYIYIRCSFNSVICEKALVLLFLSSLFFTVAFCVAFCRLLVFVFTLLCLFVLLLVCFIVCSLSVVRCYSVAVIACRCLCFPYDCFYTSHVLLLGYRFLLFNVLVGRYLSAFYIFSLIYVLSGLIFTKSDKNAYNRLFALVRIIARINQNPVKTLKNSPKMRNTIETIHCYSGRYLSLLYIFPYKC